jgi:hypothetical protein
MCVSCTTVDGHLKSSGLKTLRAEDQSEVEMVQVVKLLCSRAFHFEKGPHQVSGLHDNSYLTRNEELYIVQVVVLLADMGHAVSKNDCIKLIDEYINLDEDEPQ